MDVCESELVLGKHKAVETPRPPLVLAEKNNAATTTTRRSRTREVSSRYKSPTPSTPTGPRRCPSPNVTRATPASSSQLVPKRALSAERKRPSNPPSPLPPPRPSTPVHDSSIHVNSSLRRTAGSRLPGADSLWPSTMRSLSVSFQSDTISIRVSKKEKPVTSASDRTLRPASNVAAHKQPESPTIRKPTPERKRSPLKGNNGSDQSENSKPVDILSSRLRDQHRWPSRIGGKVSPCSLNKSVDHADTRVANTSVSGSGFSSLRRSSLSKEAGKPLQRASSDAVRQLLLIGSGRTGSEVKSVDDCSLQVLRPQKSVLATPSDKAGLAISGVRSQSLSAAGSRPPSPSRTSVLSIGASPSTSRPSTPPSRGVSPSRIRPTNSSIQSNNSISVLSFIADLKKGKKGATYIEDAHQLRLLYNRYLQWRFANARAEAVLYIQNAIVEKTLYNVWNATLSLWESVIRKRINLQQLKLKLKLNSVLNDHMTYLDDWAVVERDHVDALSGAVEDLEASTLRLPLTGGAVADIEYLKVAICQAVDVMQAMGSAICSLLSQVEGMNDVISEVAVVVAQEKAMLDECEMLLASVAAMQVEESSLRAHLMQIKQALGRIK